MSSKHPFPCTRCPHSCLWHRGAIAELSFPYAKCMRLKGRELPGAILHPIACTLLLCTTGLQPVKAFKYGERHCLASGWAVLAHRYAYFKSLAGRGLQTTQLNRFHAECPPHTQTTTSTPRSALPGHPLAMGEGSFPSAGEAADLPFVPTKLFLNWG